MDTYAWNLQQFGNKHICFVVILLFDFVFILL